MYGVVGIVRGKSGLPMVLFGPIYGMVSTDWVAELKAARPASNFAAFAEEPQVSLRA